MGICLLRQFTENNTCEGMKEAGLGEVKTACGLVKVSDNPIRSSRVGTVPPRGPEMKQETGPFYASPDESKMPATPSRVCHLR